MLSKVFKVPMNSPNDVSGIKRFLENREFEAKDIIAFMGKTEGNGCVNDFSRGFAGGLACPAVMNFINIP